MANIPDIAFFVGGLIVIVAVIGYVSIKETQIKLQAKGAVEGQGRINAETAAEIALSHHERWDGRGYPRGLAGEAIPLFARIVAVADVFDALSSRRAYKDAWPRERIDSFFRDEAGRHFDPELAAILVANIADAEALRARRPE